jgi:hypothetical protein
VRRLVVRDLLPPDVKGPVVAKAPVVESAPAVAAAVFPAAATGPAPAPSAARLVLRLAVGGTLVVLDDAGQALRRLEARVLNDQVTAGATPLPPPSARHVLIGALAVAPTWVNQLLRRGSDAVAGPARQVSRPVRFAARWLPTERLHRWSDDVRTRAYTTALNLAEVGRREEQSGRALARAVSAAGLTSALDRVAASPQVQAVIREQSAGMGRSALDDLRAQSARADAMAQSVVGHLLPRPRRKNPDGSGSR